MLKSRLLAAVGIVAALAALTRVPVRAQSPSPTADPRFEVASVKPNNSRDMRRMGYDFKGGRLVANSLPLQVLIGVAYDLPFQSDRISGGPDWIRSQAFDIEAKAVIPPELSVKAREAAMRSMLQTLLADRFKLTLRREIKERPVYALSIGKNGSKLQKAKIEEKDCTDGPDRCHVINGGMGRGLHAKAVDIADMVVFVANWTDRPVIDKTFVAAKVAEICAEFDVQQLAKPGEHGSSLPLPAGSPAMMLIAVPR